MGNSGNGGKNTKTVAAKHLDEKRLHEKAKRNAADATRIRTVWIGTPDPADRLRT